MALFYLTNLERDFGKLLIGKLYQIHCNVDARGHLNPTVLTCFSMKRSTSFRSLSWQSGWVASRYVTKESVLVMISWPAMRKRKAWPTISSMVKGLDVDVGWHLWGGSPVHSVEDRASVTMSKPSTPTELIERWASSTICRKSLRL